MSRAYRRIPSSTIERWRQARAEGAPLKRVAPDYGDFRYVSRICLGKARQSDPGPITPRRDRTLTTDERELIQQHVRQGLRIYGRPPSEDKVGKILDHSPGAAVAEVSRYTY
jgi:hypothetical protein